MKTAQVVVVLLLGAALSSCERTTTGLQDGDLPTPPDGGDPTSDAGDPAPDAGGRSWTDAEATAYVEALCRWQGRCLMDFYRDQQRCVELALATWGRIEDYVLRTQGRALVDPEALRACTRALELSGCFAPVEECDLIVVGLRAIGDPCQRSMDCQPDAYCDAGPLCGACSPRLQDWQPCQHHEQCARGRYCAADPSGNLRCVPYDRTLDEVCYDGSLLSSCFAGLTCTKAEGTDVGTCRPAGLAGERCSGFIVEAYPSCRFAADLACTDYSDGVCVPFETRLVGESCRGPAVRCESIARCDLPSFTCVPLGGSGDPCPCGENYYCSGSTCASRAIEGGACADDVGCDAGLVCDGPPSQKSCRRHYFLRPCD